MSKDLFLQMRAEEVATLYSQDFTKKEALLTGKRMVDDLLEKGEVDKHQFTANIVRLKAVIDTIESEIRKHLPEEKYSGFGVEFTPVQGGVLLQYEDDPIYADLKKQLKEREELLKVAFKSESEIYDSEGVQVPKVGFNQRKSSITIKF